MIFRKSVFLELITSMLFFVVVFTSVQSFSRDVKDGRNKAGIAANMEYKVHNVGNLWTAVTNWGRIGDPDFSTTNRPSMQWPGGSGTNLLYQGGIWVGAVRGPDTLVTSNYLDRGFWNPANESEFLIGDQITSPWSDFDSRCNFNDYAWGFSLDEALWVSVYQRTMTWEKADFNNYIIIEYDISNMSQDTLNDLYVGWYMDCDMGRGIDDHVAWDTDAKFSYMWDGDNPDTPEDDTADFDPASNQYTMPGYIGQKLLESPGGEVFHSYWDWEHDPVNEIEQYHILSGQKLQQDPDNAFDWRWLQSTGPFQLLPNGYLRFVTGITVGLGYDGLHENMQNMQAFYDNGLETGSADIEPATPFGFMKQITNNKVYLYWTPNPETDLSGYKLYRDNELLEVLDKSVTLYIDSTFANTEQSYSLSAVDSNGNESSAANANLMTGIMDQNSKRPESHLAAENFPNPFNPATTISYYLPQSQLTKIAVYNINGSLVKVLLNEYKQPGNYQIMWDGTDQNHHKVSSGLYFYSISNGSNHIVKKMLLVK